MSQLSNLFLSIGKPVKDEYGRTIGKVASFALTPKGQFDAVFIEFNDGKFSKQPMEHLKFDGAEVTFISTVKSRASVLCDQIPLIWRKDQALKDLAEKKKISPEIYQELHTSFDSILNQLKKDAQILTDEIADQIDNCDEQLKTLSYAVVNLELEHEIGKIDEAAYKSAFALLQETLKRINAQKSDMEQTKSKISNIMLGDSPEIEQKIKSKIAPEAKVNIEPVNEAPELPEPPVVVYVKEVGKAGI
ncbi:MAG: CdvA-like protein [Candidatus Bathyarchaeota archaeon]|nr:CdvA-like protein [Candidatus Bathyarchaeota archaeon]